MSGRKAKVGFDPPEGDVSYVCEDCGMVHDREVEERNDGNVAEPVELPAVDADQPSEQDRRLFEQMQYHIRQSRFHMQQARYHRDQIKRLASVTPEVCFPQGAVCTEDAQCCGGRCVDGFCVPK
jgi:hypothetical protein